MSLIRRIDVTVSTGEKANNGSVFLGLGGREFRLDRKGKNDFKKNANDHFVLGNSSNVDAVDNAADNDPESGVPLDDQELVLFPVYLRLEATTAWELKGATINVFLGEGASNPSKTLTILPGTQHLELGPNSGMVAFGRVLP